jgi:cysteinyl-tRNA synthetase
MAQAGRAMEAGRLAGFDAEKADAVVSLLAKAMDDSSTKYSAALDDDFNTPEAFAEIFNVIRVYNSTVKVGKPNAASAQNARAFLDWMKEKGKVFALLQESAEKFLDRLDDMLLKQKGLERSVIESKVSQRWAARLAKDFAASDQLRDELLGLGIAISDSQDGTRWEVAK